LFGIAGAAAAAMISNIVFNTLGVIIVGRKYHIWPYRAEHLKMTLAAIVVMITGFILPEMPLIPDLIFRSFVVTLLFTVVIYFWNLSDDLNRLAGSFISLIKKIKR